MRTICTQSSVRHSQKVIIVHITFWVLFLRPLDVLFTRLDFESTWPLDVYHIILCLERFDDCVGVCHGGIVADFGRKLRVTTQVETPSTAALEQSAHPLLVILWVDCPLAVSYTHLRAHETSLHLVCRLLLEKKK